MFSFIKKIFGISEATSDLMEKARNSAMMDQSGNDYSSVNLLNDDEMSFNQFMDHNYENDLMQQQMQDMHDPYLNPGQDIVVDESYHGIDHGMDDSFHHHDH